MTDNAPPELPEFRHKMLGAFLALLSGLFAFFFVDSLKVTVQVKKRLTKLAVQSGGTVVFVLMLWCWTYSDFMPVKAVQAGEQSISVAGSNNTTQGNYSPAIISSNGDVNVQYGIPQKEWLFGFTVFAFVLLIFGLHKNKQTTVNATNGGVAIGGDSHGLIITNVTTTTNNNATDATEKKTGMNFWNVFNFICGIATLLGLALTVIPLLNKS